MDPPVLKETTLHLRAARCLRVEIESLLDVDRCFGELLGKDPAFRAKFILESSGRAVAEEWMCDAGPVLASRERERPEARFVIAPRLRSLTLPARRLQPLHLPPLAVLLPHERVGFLRRS